MRLSLLLVTLSFAVACSPAERGAQSETPQALETVVGQQNNHFDYVELAAEDLAAVKAFYSAAFGWAFQDWGDAYVSFAGAGLDGGVRGGEKPVDGSTLVILYADDLEASEKRVVDAGGEILERHDFPGGRRVHFRDPSGNRLAVWTKVEQE